MKKRSRESEAGKWKLCPCIACGPGAIRVSIRTYRRHRDDPIYTPSIAAWALFGPDQHKYAWPLYGPGYDLPHVEDEWEPDAEEEEEDEGEPASLGSQDVHDG